MLTKEAGVDRFFLSDQILMKYDLLESMIDFVSDKF